MARLKSRTLQDEAWYEREPWGAFWERGYRDQSVSTMGGPSQEVLEMLPALPPNGKVLDLGCGEGRNSVFLAGKGFEVTAVDRSDAAISKLQRIARDARLDLNAFVGDIANITIEEDFDLVMAHGVLYYLSNQEWRELLEQVKAHTRAGGFNAYSVFIFNEEYPRTGEFKSARYTNSFAPNELLEFYEGWEILRYDSYVKWDQHPGIPLHYHPVEKLVARRPGAGPRANVVNVPVRDRNMPDEVFHSLAMGTPVSALLAACGEPDAIQSYDFDGVQIGATSAVVDSHGLSLWFYGRTVAYVVNGAIWGRAKFSSAPVRLTFDREP